MKILAGPLQGIAIVAASAGAGFGVLCLMDRMHLLGKGPEILIGFAVAVWTGVALLRKSRLHRSTPRF